MENLTKENFFNEMKVKYPNAMDHFCKWIDEYKNKVHWDALFHNNASGYHNYRVKPNIKFHDLPIGMQIGIFFEYQSEHGDKLTDDFHEFCRIHFEKLFNLNERIIVVCGKIDKSLPKN